MVSKNNLAALKLSIEFFKSNYALSFAVIGVLILLNLLSYLPIIGIVFVFAYSVLNLSIQIYFGRVVKNAQNKEDVASEATQMKISDFLTRYLAEAAGAFLGLFFIALILFFLIFVLAMAFGGADFESINHFESVNQQEIFFQMVGVYFVPSIVILTIVGFLFYVLPAVFGEVFMSESFNEAFNKSFLLLKPSFWKKTFNKSYFVLILIWSIAVFVFYTLSVILSMTLILLPVALVILYILALYNAAIYVFARELLSE